MTKLVIAVASAFVLASTYSAFADEIGTACASDIQKYCSGVSADEIEDCLQGKMSDLSQECGKAVRQE